MANKPVEPVEEESPVKVPEDLCTWCDRSLSTVEWCQRCGFGERPSPAEDE